MQTSRGYKECCDLHRQSLDRIPSSTGEPAKSALRSISASPEPCSGGGNLPPLKQRILLGVGTDKTQHCVTIALVRQTNPRKLILKQQNALSLSLFSPPPSTGIDQIVNFLLKRKISYHEQRPLGILGWSGGFWEAPGLPFASTLSLHLM